MLSSHQVPPLTCHYHLPPSRLLRQRAIRALHAPGVPRAPCAPRAPPNLLRTLQDSLYAYAGDQTKVSQTGVKDEPQKDMWPKLVTLTIMHIDGSAIKPTFLADPALSVHQLLHEPLLAGALSVDDDTKFKM